MLEILERLEESEHLRKLKRPEHYRQWIESTPSAKTPKSENS